MAFAAKYPGVCAGCNGRFPAGEQIHWQKNAAGKGQSWHLRCRSAAPAPVAAPAAPAQPRQVTLAAWEAYAATLVRPACSGCADGCWGCDSSEDSMHSW